jgi:integral membrane protein
MTAPSQDAAQSQPAAHSPAAAPVPSQPTPVTGARPGAAPARQAALRKAYARYRLLAYVVGCVLVVLVLVAVPLKYAAGTPQLVSIIGPVHGVLYIVYLLATFDLATKAKFAFKRTILVMLAGTIPFVSFVAEHWVTNKLRSSHELT